MTKKSEAHRSSGQPVITSRRQDGTSKGIAPGPAGEEQTDDQDNLNNNVSNVGTPPSDGAGGVKSRP